MQQRLVLLLLVLLALGSGTASNLLLGAAGRHSGSSSTRSRNRATAAARPFSAASTSLPEASAVGSPSFIAAFPANLLGSISGYSLWSSGSTRRLGLRGLRGPPELSEWQQARPVQQQLLLRQKLQQLQRHQEEHNETRKEQEQRQRHINNELNQMANDELESFELSPTPQLDEQQRYQDTEHPHRDSQKHPHPPHEQQLPPLSPVDIAVLGGGHAGVEAAVAASRLGLNTAILSPHGFGSLGLLSCNPSIGGSGKSHLVSETDACGGLIGRAADIAAVHWRVLNVSRGPAAWAPRAQIDRACFSRCIRRFVSAFPSISVIDGAAEEILTDRQNEQQHQRKRVWGVRLRDGRELEAHAVVVAAGTFLDAAVAVGRSRAAGGRMHSLAEASKEVPGRQQQDLSLPPAISDLEPAAKGLAASLRELGLKTAYFKTGTNQHVVLEAEAFFYFLTG